MKVFTEEQRFKKWFLLPLLALPFFGIMAPFIFKENNSISQNSEAFWAITITIFVLLAVTIFILSINLKTKIDEQGIFYQFYPINLSQKLISWNEIDKCYLKKYNSLKDFGGYGYRLKPFGKLRGKSINVGGKYGIQLELKNGKNLLLGTQRENDIKQILETYKEKIHQ